MVNLPFELVIALPVMTFSGTVEIVLEGPLGPGQPGHEPSQEMVSLFAVALARQLFTEASARIETNANITAFARDDKGTRAEYRLTVNNCRPASFIVLISLLAQVCFAGDILSRLSISNASSAVFAGDEPVFGAEKLLEGLPELCVLNLPQDLSFSVKLAEKIDSPLTNVTYNFVKPLMPSVFYDIRECLNVWGHIVQLGGYLFSFTEQEDFTDEFGRTAHVAPARVEHVWAPFEGVEGAHVPLINLAAHWNRRGVLVKSIAIS